MELLTIGRFLLGVFLLGMTGTLAELALLAHYEDATQLIPLVLLTAGLLAVSWHLFRPSRWTLLVLQVIMVLFVAGGLLGVVLHYQGSREFQLETDPSISGTELWWKILRAKAPPTLAPGTLVQLGLLGLAYVFTEVKMRKAGRVVAGAILAIVLATGSAAFAQVGKSLGVVDVNTASEQALVAMPSMTSPVVKALIAARPFGSILELNKFLLGQKLTQAQANAFYGKAFVHINLNTATPDEILLVPGAGKRMAHEFEEYRPWKTWGQFEKEIGKYVNAQEVARLAQYAFIPVRLNSATDADILSIPGAGQRMVREFKEYRPWKTMEQFNREIGKYVDQKEVQRLARYVVIE
jgi:DNA uptake protein ComE-like DNA-binding protein